MINQPAKSKSALLAALRHCIAASVLAAILALASIALADEGRAFAHPERIRYDGHCLTIEGKDMVVYSGAFHYFRCPKELWQDRFDKIKAAGFNTVETYVAWNRCEEEMPAGLDDFSKVHLQDLEDWLNMAEKAGLYVIIRPGPYICAEWDRGGFPGWLVTKRPEHPKEKLWFRSDDPTFIAWSKHWYDAVCPMLAKHQITRKQPGEKGIILFQLENEYDYSRFSAEIKNAYVRALGQAAIAQGIDVPLMTCWTGSIRGSQDPVLRQVFDSCNFYTGWGVVKGTKSAMEKLRTSQPDAPMMTTELQGGWFVGIGDEPPIRPDVDNYRPDLVPAQITNLTLFAYQNGETITNYYMLFGGTNMGDGAAQNIATCYDYSCPIRENGGVGGKYLRVKALGEFIRAHGARLARTDAVDAEVKTDQPDVTVAVRQATDGGRYFFVRTDQHAEPRTGTASVAIKPGQVVGNHAVNVEKLAFQYDLEPFGSKVLYAAPDKSHPQKMEWWPKAQPAIERPGGLPPGVKISAVLAKADPGPQAWKPLPAGQHLNDVGIYDSRFVYYRGKVNVDAQALSGTPWLRTDVATPDSILAAVNGQAVIAKSSGALGDLPTLHAGENTVTLLYETAGYANGGAGMEKLAGISRLRLVPPVDPKATLKGWRMKVIENTDPRPQTAADFADADWPKVQADTPDAAHQLKPGQTAVFRVTAELTQKDLDAGRTALAVGRMDDEGTVYVNGQKIGEGHAWDESYTFDAGKAVHVGRNVIAVVIQNSEGVGGLGGVQWTLPASAGQDSGAALEYSDSPAGVAGQWWKTDLDDAAWTRQTLPEQASNDASMLAWRRLAFELPQRQPGVWLPWLIRLHTTGNGFIYLNGHAIGRLWQRGKQTDYYLPECWLNFGPKNVVTLCLRPADKPVAVESAEVIPYTFYAEKR